jgi:hypothetical protein
MFFWHPIKANRRAKGQRKQKDSSPSTRPNRTPNEVANKPTKIHRPEASSPSVSKSGTNQPALSEQTFHFEKTQAHSPMQQPALVIPKRRALRDVTEPQRPPKRFYQDVATNTKFPTMVTPLPSPLTNEVTAQQPFDRDYYFITSQGGLATDATEHPHSIADYQPNFSTTGVWLPGTALYSMAQAEEVKLDDPIPTPLHEHPYAAMYDTYPLTPCDPTSDCNTVDPGPSQMCQPSLWNGWLV